MRFGALSFKCKGMGLRGMHKVLDFSLGEVGKFNEAFCIMHGGPDRSGDLIFLFFVNNLDSQQSLCLFMTLFSKVSQLGHQRYGIWGKDGVGGLGSYANRGDDGCTC